MLRGETLAYSTEDMPPEAAIDQESAAITVPNLR